MYAQSNEQGTDGAPLNLVATPMSGIETLSTAAGYVEGGLSPVHTSNMSKQHVERQQATCRSNIRHVEATFGMLLPHVEFDMLLRHVAGVDGALVKQSD